MYIYIYIYIYILTHTHIAQLLKPIVSQRVDEYLGCLFLCLEFKMFLFFFWPHHKACRILLPRSKIGPIPPAVEAQSLNCWAAREAPKYIVLNRWRKWRSLRVMDRTETTA